MKAKAKKRSKSASTTLKVKDLRSKRGPMRAGSAASIVRRDVTVNKAKTADKAYSMMDAYIKG